MALVILRKSLKNRTVLVCLDQVTHTQGRTQEFAFGGLSFFQGGSAPAVREGRGWGVSPQNPTMSAHTVYNFNEDRKPLKYNGSKAELH